ncbi:MAG: hypothetical protein AAFO61_07715 [Pseudomonadota bacterium]
MTKLKMSNGSFCKLALAAVLATAVTALDFDRAEAAALTITGSPGVVQGGLVQEVQQRRIRRNRNRNARRNRNAAIGLGVAGAVIGAIAADRARRTRQRRYARDCWYETEERWSPRRQRYVVREVRVCD